MSDHICAHCRHVDLDTAECRRFPPTPILKHVGDPRTQFVAVFPVIELDWWCGEWKEPS